MLGTIENEAVVQAVLGMFNIVRVQACNAYARFKHSPECFFRPHSLAKGDFCAQWELINRVLNTGLRVKNCDCTQNGSNYSQYNKTVQQFLHQTVLTARSPFFIFSDMILKYEWMSISSPAFPLWGGVHCLFFSLVTVCVFSLQYYFYLLCFPGWPLP